MLTSRLSHMSAQIVWSMVCNVKMGKLLTPEVKWELIV